MLSVWRALKRHSECPCSTSAGEEDATGDDVSDKHWSVRATVDMTDKVMNVRSKHDGVYNLSHLSTLPTCIALCPDPTLSRKRVW